MTDISLMILMTVSSLKQIANDGDVCFIMNEDDVIPNTPYPRLNVVEPTPARPSQS